jgi:hypothetical protein
MIIFVFALFYSRKVLQFDRNIKFMSKSLFASVVISLILIAWNPAGVLSIVLSVLFCSPIYAGIVFALKGFTREEFALFKDLIAFG